MAFCKHRYRIVFRSRPDNDDKWVIKNCRRCDTWVKDEMTLTKTEWGVKPAVKRSMMVVNGRHNDENIQNHTSNVQNTESSSTKDPAITGSQASEGQVL